MSFCTKCGNQLNDDDAFCAVCGNPIMQQTQTQPQEQASQSQMQIQSQVPFQQPVYGYFKPRIPGRGLSIAGMILSILGVILGIYFFSQAVDDTSILNEYKGRDFYDFYDFTKYFSEEITTILYCSIFPALALIFSCIGRSKGYRNGMSTSGIVLSCIGLLGFIGALVVYYSI